MKVQNCQVVQIVVHYWMVNQMVHYLLDHYMVVLMNFVEVENPQHLAAVLVQVRVSMTPMVLVMLYTVVYWSLLARLGNCLAEHQQEILDLMMGTLIQVPQNYLDCLGQNYY
jgi:dipeptide/tripeptide permease